MRDLQWTRQMMGVELAKLQKSNGHNDMCLIAADLDAQNGAGQ